jgi:anti-sigma factor RsiW
MNRPCPDMRDRIADYVLGALDEPQAEALRMHLAGCPDCRQHFHSLKQQGEALAELGGQLSDCMTARQDRVIGALEDVVPAALRLPLIGGLLKTAVAAVVILSAGIAIGRWTAPPQVNVEQLRAQVEASVTAAVQDSLLTETDRRLQASLFANDEHLRRDLRAFAAQVASNAETMMSRQYADLVDIIEAGRKTDRMRVEKALEQIREQTGRGLYALAVRTSDSEPAANAQN